MYPETITDVDDVDDLSLVCSFSETPTVKEARCWFVGPKRRFWFGGVLETPTVSSNVDS